MKVEFSLPRFTVDSGVCTCRAEQESLINSLQEAKTLATHRQRSILASVTFPVTCCGALQVFTRAGQAQLGECFYWEQAAQQTALVGIGSAASIETKGGDCIPAAALQWRALMQDALISYTPAAAARPGNGPVLFGGFAFDPLATRTQLWAGFPDGLLILPRLLLSYSGNSVTLTLNSMITASDAIEQKALEIESGLRLLQAALEQASQQASQQASHTSERSPATFQTLAMLSPALWRARVAETRQEIRQGAFEKVVLAREMQIVMDDPTVPFAIDMTLNALRADNPGAFIFAIQRGERFFVGATPERLVLAQDGRISTMALAGTARRGADAAEDARLGAELLQSGKNQHEHAIVVDRVVESLRQYCTHMRVSDAPQLLKLHNVQHLQTPIAAELTPGYCVLDVMAGLHPTPAVAGFPRACALAQIRSVEKLDRGWYAGPLGWIGSGGNGEFAVALRCGLIDGPRATLFAGCGIVADSLPRVEYAESTLKFQTMLRALLGSASQV